MGVSITKENKFFNQKRKARILPSVILSIALSIVLFISSPLEIFSSNVAEFKFALSDFMWWIALVAIAFSVLVFCLLFFTPIVVNRVVYGFFTALLLLLFIQGNYLNQGLTLSGDGTSGTGVSVGATIVNIIVWALITALLIYLVLAVRKGGIIRTVCFFLSAIIFLISLITMTVNIVSANKNQVNGILINKAESGDENYQPHFLTYKNITTFSENKNVIVFCIDRFDSIDNAEPNMALFNQLDGFTYFNDHISMYGHTYPSVVYMLTGVEHDSSLTRAEYFKKAYKENNTLKVLSDNNYSINVYTDYYYAYDDAYYMPDYIDNLIETDIDSTKKVVDNKPFLAGRMLQLGFYRNFPIALKEPVAGSITSSTCNSFVHYTADNMTEKEYTLDMKNLNDRVKDNGVSTRDDKNNFTFIHVTGCHSVEYDENWQTPSRKDRKNFDISVRNSFKIINEYIKEMKRLGIYKDATIIITGDHADPKYDYGKIQNAKLTALFVKPSGKGSNHGKSEKLNVSSAQVSHENFWGTIFKSEGITASGFKPSVFDVKENENQTRKYLWDYHDHAYTKYWRCNYTINGSARNLSNWKLTENDVSLIERDLYN